MKTRLYKLKTPKYLSISYFLNCEPFTVRGHLYDESWLWIVFCNNVLFAADKVIKINKNLIKKKRGECVEFRAEHYFRLNASSTFVWKKQHTSTMVENDRISISDDRRKLDISHLTEADTALYSSEVLTTGGLEVTQYWLVVQGEYWPGLCVLGRRNGLLRTMYPC